MTLTGKYYLGMFVPVLFSETPMCVWNNLVSSKCFETILVAVVLVYGFSMTYDFVFVFLNLVNFYSINLRHRLRYT